MTSLRAPVGLRSDLRTGPPYGTPKRTPCADSNGDNGRTDEERLTFNTSFNSRTAHERRQGNIR